MLSRGPHANFRRIHSRSRNARIFVANNLMMSGPNKPLVKVSMDHPFAFQGTLSFTPVERTIPSTDRKQPPDELA
jgi:hypothetical protein